MSMIPARAAELMAVGSVPAALLLALDGAPTAFSSPPDAPPPRA